MANVNPPPLNSSIDDIPNIRAKLSMAWQGYFSRLHNFINQIIIDYSSASYQQPATGFSITIGDNIQVLTLDPAGTLATGTITMPATPVNGMTVTVSTTQTITALTVSPNGSQSIKNAPTTLNAGTGFMYYYNQSKTTWYRLY